jgi:ribonuclease Z
MKTLAELLRHRVGAVIVCTPPRSRKDRWWWALSETLVDRQVDFDILSADPGSPLAGPPGAVTLLRRQRNGLEISRLAALCTLDAARFRLPLLMAAARLRRRATAPLLLVDAPSIYRGMAATEILDGLIEELDATTLVAAGVAIVEVGARAVEILKAEEAPGNETRSERLARRSSSWKSYLDGCESVAHRILPFVGAPPPASSREAWPGRQIAVLDADGETLTFGECLDLDTYEIRFVAPSCDLERARAYLVRDARRDEAGRLATAPRLPRADSEPLVTDLHAGVGEVEARPRVTSLKTAKALLVNGVFGDPLLHIRLRHRKRSVLFDLGESARLPARIVHQVSDVFVSHAHFDHIGGFLWFLRSCIGSPMRRRIFGPPGLADHLEGMIAGIRWDRIGGRGPRFEVGEIHGGSLERCLIRVGASGREALEPRPIDGGVLVQEPELEIRALELDHGIPVLAFAFVEHRVLQVRKDRLEADALPPGRWLGDLKRALLHGHGNAEIALPDGDCRRAADLAEDLLLSSPGGKLVYATDLDDTHANRRDLIEFARGAHLFYCEATFLEEDHALARATQHLTARAAGEIAASANVAALVPFHFSKRYEHAPEAVYAEVRAAFPNRIIGIG